MDEVVTQETLHRTAKYFMDSGRSDSHEQAMNVLRGFGLNIEVGPEVATSRDHQIALLTLVNAARRTFLAGVRVGGVDNAMARASLEEAGFGLVVETGLGAGPQAFRSFSLHTFPSSLNAAQIWAKDSGPTGPKVSEMPAYQASKHPGLDECGLAQLASRTVGVPFVGLSTAALAIAELLRRLHGGPALELVSGSVTALEDVEISSVQGGIYEFGHVIAAT